MPFVHFLLVFVHFHFSVHYFTEASWWYMLFTTVPLNWNAVNFWIYIDFESKASVSAPNLSFQTSLAFRVRCSSRSRVSMSFVDVKRILTEMARPEFTVFSYCFIYFVLHQFNIVFGGFLYLSKQNWQYHNIISLLSSHRLCSSRDIPRCFDLIMNN